MPCTQRRTGRSRRPCSSPTEREPPDLSKLLFPVHSLCCSPPLPLHDGRQHAAPLQGEPREPTLNPASPWGQRPPHCRPAPRRLCADLRQAPSRGAAGCARTLCKVQHARCQRVSVGDRQSSSGVREREKKDRKRERENSISSRSLSFFRFGMPSDRCATFNRHARASAPLGWAWRAAGCGGVAECPGPRGPASVLCHSLEVGVAIVGPGVVLDRTLLQQRHCDRDTRGCARERGREGERETDAMERGKLQRSAKTIFEFSRRFSCVGHFALQNCYAFCITAVMVLEAAGSASRGEDGDVYGCFDLCAGMGSGRACVRVWKG